MLSSGWLLSSIDRFSGSGGWAGWLAGLGWQLAAISSIFIDFQGFPEIFIGFHGFQGPEVRSLCRHFANGMMALKKPLLDPSWLLFQRFSWISFLKFHRFLGISGARGSQPVPTFCKRNDAPKETFTRSQLAAISLIFIDFRVFRDIS